MSANAASSAWPLYKLCLVIGALFGIQLVLILWLSRNPHTQAEPAAASPASVVQVVQPSLALASGDSPILLALPNPRGFSGDAWLSFGPVEHKAESWTEPERFLQLSPDQVSNSLSNLLSGSLSPPYTVSVRPEPMPYTPDYFPHEFTTTESSCTVEGDLAGRKRLSDLKLTNWPSATLLSNSVVEIFVDGRGEVAFNPALIQKSGSDSADARALELARGARFAPLRGAAAADPPLVQGRLVFHWVTAALPAAAAGH